MGIFKGQKGAGSGGEFLPRRREQSAVPGYHDRPASRADAPSSHLGHDRLCPTNGGGGGGGGGGGAAEMVGKCRFHFELGLTLQKRVIFF